MSEFNKNVYWEADFTKVGKCECCETSEGVWAINPFIEDVCNEEVWEYLCEECYKNLVLDI
jgi:hypothetical protein